jgi:hypothetical protein
MARIQTKKISRRLDLVLSELEFGRTEFEAINKIGKELGDLPVERVNALFPKGQKDHPGAESELAIGWARVLAAKAQCGEALKTLAEVRVQADMDIFWKNTRVQTLQKCKPL